MNSISIGAVFTPLKWAIFAIKKFNLFDKWLNGAKVFDPTMGDGNLLEAFILLGIQKEIPISELPIHNLYGVELNTNYFESFFERIESVYGIVLSKNNFLNEDIFYLEKEISFDIIFGNPPWQNFNDLPSEYKERIKPQFFKYDLINNAKDMLLGGSRIDISALVIQKVIEKNLKPGCEAIFFMPLSLLLNDGAHKFFRTYKINSTQYFIDKVFDFNDAGVFNGIATRYGLVHFIRDSRQSFPIEYNRWENGNWDSLFARPTFHSTDPLSVHADSAFTHFENFEMITISKKSTPRQGVNTCGANEVFFFDSCVEQGEYCVLSNKVVRECILPKKYIQPLITTGNFKENENPLKWVFLPYNSDGKPLTFHQIEKENCLREYLLSKKEILENRKGTMLNAHIKRGIWWALLGVGEYNFSQYKIVWEAYGRTTFNPKIFQGNWQANQSLQAFIPVHTLHEAVRVLALLKDDRIEQYLLSLKMEGTMNWAQPGKIKKLLHFTEETELELEY